jgi:transposase InsO family protein
MVQEKLKLSESRACRVIGQHRSTQRYQIKKLPDEDSLTLRIIELACKYGRYGYRRIAALLQAEGYEVNHKRVERIWREQGLKVPQKQKKRRRLWLNDGSCLRLRPEYKSQVYSYDMVHDRTSDGKAFRILNIIDEYSRECLCCFTARHIHWQNIQEQLTNVFIQYGMPEYLRSDNGSEFTANNLREWLNNLEINTTYIEPGSPWENGYVESFNGKMRDELLNGEIFDNIFEARTLIEQWRKDYNTVRPHSSLGYKPPAPVAIQFNPDKCCENSLSGQ